jgi:beta-lactamase class A
MQRFSVFLLFAFLANTAVFLSNSSGQKRSEEITKPVNYSPPEFKQSIRLRSILHSSVNEVISKYSSGGFRADEIAATLIDLNDATDLKWADLNGDNKIYPASVVKMFYMAALERQLDDKKITLTKEMERGLRDMIVDSSNEATQYILDVLTNTSSGAELPQKQFEKWQYKRNRVNRFFASLGYQNINVNQKTHCEDAYGVEQQSRNYKGENRNMLTTNATARLLAEIASRRFVSTERSSAMLALMKRDPFRKTNDPDDQSTGFIGKAILDGNLKGISLWSKAGWTSRSRHDAAYLETSDGLKFVLVIFTENHANDRDAIPAIAATIITKLREARS